MMRSMYSAVSSLRAHQFRMDVIGNNIANVNTLGFKGSRATFKDIFSQTIRGGSSPQGSRGGTNPMQVGLGIDVSTVDTFHIQGTPESTGNPTDVMINGNGFFVVSDDATGLNKYYTRAGNFNVDEAGNLVTAEGLRVQGYQYDSEGKPTATLAGIKIDKSTVVPPKKTSAIELAGNIDSKTTVFTGTPIVGAGGVYVETPAGSGKYVINDAHKSSVARETTMAVYDSLGTPHQIKLAFIKTAQSDGTSNNIYDVQAFYQKPDGTMVPAGGTGFTGAVPKVHFGPNGKFAGVGGAIATTTQSYTLSPGGTDAIGFTVDFGKLNQYSGDSTVSVTGNDGYPKGELSGFAIGQNGEVAGVFSNGQNKNLARVAIADFVNPPGLMKVANNLYKDSNNSGEPNIGVPASGGFGDLTPGALEMSNVDLGREFTNMITTQRGFQANSRVISTTDQMLEELVNLKR